MNKVLIIGSGGREHALGWKLSYDAKVYFSPGNAGTIEDGENVILKTNKDIYDFIKKEKVDLTVVGPEGPLEEGIVDYLNFRGYNKVFGPTKEMARIESDKFYSFEIMDKLKIPQAQSKLCYNVKEMYKAIKDVGSDKGVVVKARGLCAGKGVAVYNSIEEAMLNLENQIQCFGSEMQVSERLFGEEFSVFGICDGKNVLPIYTSFQDHKRLLDNDLGPNTGGMGAYSPVPFVTDKMLNYVFKEIMQPIVREIGFKGFLYTGMMNTSKGLKVIEFNCRFGDPECQIAMMKIDKGFYSALELAVDGKVDEGEILLNQKAVATVILASRGYPIKYQKGFEIKGLDKVKNKIFHSGTANQDGKIVTNGGRILGVTASSFELKEVLEDIYLDLNKIKIKGGFSYRKDIGKKVF